VRGFEFDFTQSLSPAASRLLQPAV